MTHESMAAVLPAKRRLFGRTWLSATVLLACSMLIGAGNASAADKAAPELAPSAKAQIQVLRNLKSGRTNEQSKIDSRLVLGELHRQNDQRLTALPDFRFVVPEADGRVPVDIVLGDQAGMKAVLNALEAMDAPVESKSVAYQQIRARMRLQDMEPLARLTEVRRIRQRMPSYTHAINVSEGDATHGAAAARATYGATGAGVKICVLSDGVDSLASLQGSGDLPAVDVLPGQAGTGDEGSAMLEIVHDLAPNATLGFATAFNSEASFAQNILDLATAGCDIIVDDIIYLDESPFQDGPVAQSVNTVTAAGVLYFSSAGNEGNANDLTSGTWEGDFLASVAADPGPLAGANLHDFGDGGNSILVEFGGGNPPILIWAEHYDLATGNASTDFDIYDMDGALTTIFDASTDIQDGVGGDDFPIEFIGGGTFGGERLVIDKVADGTTSSVPMFNLIVFRGELDDNVATNGATRGHSAALNSFSVAATPAAASFDGVSAAGPFPGLFTSANESESFSSDGTRRIILDPTGAELTAGNRTASGGVVRQKPDITAADGVATAAPGFDPFYGTSAAAPHAAAIAGLLKSAVPGLTPIQVRTALISTAIDIEAAGVDSTTGVGIVMPEAALAFVGAVPQAVVVGQSATASEVAGDGDAFVEPNEDWSLLIPIENIGGADATNISATLTSATLGVVILADTSAYPDAAAAATVDNLTPYLFHLDSSALCGTVIDFTLTITYSGGVLSPQTFDFQIGTGSPGAPVVVSYAGAPVPIPDSAGANTPGTAALSTVTVPAATGGVFGMTMSIDGTVCSATAGSTTVGIEHTFANDLELTLIAPDMTPVVVINRTDGGGNNFCQTVLDDTAATGIQTLLTANAPFTGTFSPANALSAFKGKVADGDWGLQVVDYFVGDTGNIRDWSLSITPAVCDAPVQPAELVATKQITGGSQTAGGDVGYTVTLTNNGPGVQPDNMGDEFVDTLPAGLTVGTPTASAGSISGLGVNPVAWNGLLLPGESVTITIPATISPTAGGNVISNQATVNFDADRDGSNESNALSDDPGVGGAADPTDFTVLEGALTITPVSVDFGNVPVGSASGVLSVTLGNSGSASLQVTTLTAAAGPFALAGSGSCSAVPITIGVGASCTLDYTFTPAAAGAANQNLTVSADAPGSGSIALLGNGTVAILALSSAAIDFGGVDVGATSPIVLTISNTGGATLDVSSISDPGAPFSVLGGTCGAVPFMVLAGGSCDIIVEFAPVVVAPFNSAIDFVSNGGNAQTTLLGSGLSTFPAAVAVPDMIPTMSDFGRFLLIGLMGLLAFAAVRRQSP